MSHIRSQSGFTLIELVIIIVVLGILAAVAIPKYQDVTTEAQEAAVRSSLGALRSGITIYYANEAVTTGKAVWPSLDELNTVGVVMAQGLPGNPYCASAQYPDSVVLGVSKGILVGNDCGWAYNPATGNVWPNTNVSGEAAW